MAQPNANPSKAEEIRIGISGACLMMPADPAKRAEEINRLHHLAEEEKEAVEAIKDRVGLKEAIKRANKVFGISKHTLKILKILDGVPAAGDRAAILTQVFVLSKDKGDLDKDLVTLAQEAEAAAGQQADDQGSVFDKTSEGERRGGSDAQPQHVEQPAEHVGPAPTPGIPLDQALAAFEAANANYKGKGRKPKALIQAEKDLEEAKAAAAGEVQTGSAESAQIDDDLPELPAAQNGQVSREVSEGAAESDAFLKAQIEQRKVGTASSEPPAAPKAPVVLDDDLPPPAPRVANGEHRGLGPDAYH